MAILAAGFVNPAQGMEYRLPKGLTRIDCNSGDVYVNVKQIKHGVSKKQICRCLGKRSAECRRIWEKESAVEKRNRKAAEEAGIRELERIIWQ